MNSDNDLFRASLESIETGKRAQKFQRFIAEFSRECEVTLDNAQEWIKAELPLVSSHIDLAPIKEELKSSRVTTRRKHLLSALIFEQATRDAAKKHKAATSALMAMHMLNHIWKARLEVFKTQSPHLGADQDQSIDSLPPEVKSAPEKEFDLRREKILTALIEKGELQKRNSMIIKKEHSLKKPKKPKKPDLTRKKETAKKKPFKPVNRDLWKETKDSSLKRNRLAMISKKKPKKKTRGVLSKVKSRMPIKSTTKQKDDQFRKLPAASERHPNDSLLDNPNDSAILVNPGFSESIEDSIIQARPGFSNDPNESGITVRKVLKKQEQEKQDPGSNTIIMKLASSSGKQDPKNQTGLHLSIPERCQRAVNKLCQQYPSYDMVAIRNLAAKKVGVSAQYIENLNILPERKK